MKSGKDFTAVSWLAFFPVGMTAAMIAVVLVCIVGNITGCDHTRDKDNSVLLVRDYPIFKQAKDSTEPLSLDQATQQAWQWVKTGTNSGDTQYYGYARGILNPWWDSNNVSSEFRILRAVILQQQHYFDEAVTDLDQVIKSDPLNVQARLTRSAIYIATGQLNSALRDCQSVFLKADPVSVSLCAAQINGLQGKADSMIDRLNTVLAGTNLSTLQQREVRTTLAELYWSRGNIQAAEKQFEVALTITPQHGYLVSQYSTLLLSSKRYTTLISFLELQPTSLENQINLYHAQKKLSIGNIEDLRSRIEDNIEIVLKANAQENSPDHSKILSLYYMDVKNDPESSMHYAQKNWDKQKSISDAMLLMNSAAQTKSVSAADDVHDWLEKNAIQDQRLAKYGALNNG